MTNEEKNELLKTINKEGFDYCFMHYSDFKNINDEYFHKLRKTYQIAQQELKSYIETGIYYADL